MPETPAPLPDFVAWPSFPFEGELRVKPLQPPVDVEPTRKGEDANDCVACNAPDEAYIWVSERWRVRAMDRPSGLPVVLILESRSHLDLGDLPNLLAAELGVMTVRLEKAIRSLDGVARVHVNRWGDGSAHLHMWFLARPYGLLQLRGTFLALWDDILPPVSEAHWRENLALIAAWLAEFGGRPLAEPPHIDWQAPSKFEQVPASASTVVAEPASRPEPANATRSHTTAQGDDAEPGITAQKDAEPDTTSPDTTSPDHHAEPDAARPDDVPRHAAKPDAEKNDGAQADDTAEAGDPAEPGDPADPAGRVERAVEPSTKCPRVPAAREDDAATAGATPR